MNKFNKQTCLNVKYYSFIFQHIVQSHLNNYPICQHCDVVIDSQAVLNIKFRLSAFSFVPGVDVP